MNSSFKMFSSETGEPVKTSAGEFKWRPEGVHQAASHSWRWSLFIRNERDYTVFYKMQDMGSVDDLPGAFAMAEATIGLMEGL